MYCSFKKINTKTLSLITALKTIYSKQNILLKVCKDAKIENLVVEKDSFQINGTVSILNFLASEKYSPSNLEHFFWVENSLVDKQEMKSVFQFFIIQDSRKVPKSGKTRKLQITREDHKRREGAIFSDKFRESKN